ncbi:hypothetical protein [Bacillus sp. 03113]|uniref:hypothetical protein n=1 Tax=Bacillus sp. 03113 TaxID=2578211 RepID=UPI001143D6D9|nr:hypothetical protein [Bacillus sp. 03113]
MNNWVANLLSGRRPSILQLFGRRRRNRGMFWWSLLGIGVSAAAYRMRRTQSRAQIMNAVQSMLRNKNTKTKPFRTPHEAAITEFSNEISPNKKPYSNH